MGLWCCAFGAEYLRICSACRRAICVCRFYEVAGCEWRAEWRHIFACIHRDPDDPWWMCACVGRCCRWGLVGFVVGLAPEDNDVELPPSTFACSTCLRVEYPFRASVVSVAGISVQRVDVALVKTAEFSEVRPLYASCPVAKVNGANVMQ